MYVFVALDVSIDSLSLYSLKSMARAVPRVHTKYSKGSKWSHAKPEPLSTNANPSLRELTLTRRRMDTTEKATQTSLNDAHAAKSSTSAKAINSLLSLKIYSLDEPATAAESQDE